MRELDRHAADHTADTPNPSGTGRARVAPDRARVRSVAIVGAGRVGTALGEALRQAGLVVHGPTGRDGAPATPANGAGPSDAGRPDALLLCVPDAEIPAAARRAAGSAPLVGHTSGATPLSAIEPAAAEGAELFGLHPLQTLTGVEDRGRLRGAGCAIAGSTPRALRAARDLAVRVGLEPFEIADEKRAAYHAAASAASNFLLTLQDTAERVAEGAGMSREDARRALAPLVRATVENWARLGPEEALTGPVARGDEATVAAHRAAVERVDPDLLPVFDALLERTRHLAVRRRKSAPSPSPEVGSR